MMLLDEREKEKEREHIFNVIKLLISYLNFKRSPQQMRTPQMNKFNSLKSAKLLCHH